MVAAVARSECTQRPFHFGAVTGFEAIQIVSPVSILLALAMAYNGAASGTRTAMAKTLAVPSLGDDDFNRANHDLLRTLRKADPAVQIEIANALWTQSGFPVDPHFLKLSQDSYDASARSVNFAGNPREAADTINGWVDKNTHGKIPTIIATPDPNTRWCLSIGGKVVGMVIDERAVD